MQPKTWVEISQANLIHNIDQFRQRVGSEVKIAGVIKSNAYGHGLIEVAQVVQSRVDWLAVDSVDEALRLHTTYNFQLTIPIIILGYTLLENLEQIVVNGFHQVVANYETLEKLAEVSSRLQKPTFVHLKIETGTSRQGIWQNDLDKYLDLISQNTFLKLAGVSTHFANIEDTTDHSYAEKQLENFKQAVSYIESKGFTNFIKHTACSAATVLFPQTYFDMVRVGISMYGMWSSTETQVSAMQKGINIDIRPALTWKTKVAHLKTLPAGASVSYGCTEKLTSETKVAVLPIGYWDGFDRGLSSVGNVLIRGQRCRVIGRVCMNMIVIDVNHISDIKLEDEVVLLGKQASETITAEEIARKIGTINYEVTTRINSLIRRVKEGEEDSRSVNKVDESSKPFYKTMAVWQSIEQLNEIVNDVLICIHKNEFKCRSQIANANDSVGSNFVEGYYSGYIKEYIRFLKYSRRSGQELYSRVTNLFIRKVIGNNLYTKFDDRCKKTMFLIDRTRYGLENKVKLNEKISNQN